MKTITCMQTQPDALPRRPEPALTGHPGGAASGSRADE